MSLTDLTEPNAIRLALREFDELGRDEFLRRYGFGPSKEYFVEFDGKQYDSKAIVGAAYGHQYPERGPLRHEQFSGGDATVRPKLEELGFVVHRAKAEDHGSFASILARVLELQHSYDSKNTPEMQERGRLIRTDGPRLLRGLLPTGASLSFIPGIEGRDGTGLKTRCPWIRIYSRDRSPSATTGWYIVFLFATDGSAVYLSLNQGTTVFEQGEFRGRSSSYLVERVAWARDLGRNAVDDPRLETTMVLKDPRGLGEGYEQGHVVGYRYDVESLPEDEPIRLDLARMLSLLDRVYVAEDKPQDEPEARTPDVEVGAVSPARWSELAWETLRRETLWDLESLREVVDTLKEGSRQLVLAGPPGTGKTRVATAVARFLTGGDARRWRLVQFHPTYGYEEFVEGLRPTVSEGVPIFQVRDGIVKDMAAQAEAGDELHVLVIDEMNRANLPRVFGELMYLLEYRDAPIDLQYSRQFRLPRNLLFVGTMNTADRSIRSIDVALRRRFEIFDCPPDRRILERFYDEVGRNEVAGLVDGFDRLNEVLTTQLDRHHAVGHTFFMDDEMTTQRLRRVWMRQIGPLIEEYFFDQPDVATQFVLERFWPGL